MSTEADPEADQEADQTTRLVVLDRGRELSGVVRPGESWSAAARRTCASLHVEPEPLDLSGDVLRFVVDHDAKVGLRAMTHADLDDVVAWREAPEVRRWWSPGEMAEDRSAMEQTYLDRVEGRSPTRMWIAEVNGRSAGFVQDYRIGDYPDYAALGPDADAIGVDYALGAEQWRGQGLGARVLWAWMLRARRRFAEATTYFAAPDHRNTASRRVLEKAGFAAGLWFDEPQPDGSATTVVGHTLDVPAVLG